MRAAAAMPAGAEGRSRQAAAGGGRTSLAWAPYTSGGWPVRTLSFAQPGCFCQLLWSAQLQLMPQLLHWGPSGLGVERPARLSSTPQCAPPTEQPTSRCRPPQAAQRRVSRARGAAAVRPVRSHPPTELPGQLLRLVPPAGLAAAVAQPGAGRRRHAAAVQVGGTIVGRTGVGGTGVSSTGVSITEAEDGAEDLVFWRGGAFRHLIATDYIDAQSPRLKSTKSALLHRHDCGSGEGAGAGAPAPAAGRQDPPAVEVLAAEHHSRQAQDWWVQSSGVGRGKAASSSERWRARRCFCDRHCHRLGCQCCCLPVPLPPPRILLCPPTQLRCAQAARN